MGMLAELKDLSYKYGSTLQIPLKFQEVTKCTRRTNTVIHHTRHGIIKAQLIRENL